MTNELISRVHRSTEDVRRLPVVADLVFWSAAGAVVAALSGPLGHWWDAPPTALLAGGVAFLVGGVGVLFVLHRVRPIPRRLARGFALFNLILAPIVWATAWYGWLPLSSPGNWALVCAGDVALVLGVWQLSTVRRPRRAQQAHSR